MAVTWKKLAYADEVVPNSILSAAGSLITSTAASTPSELVAGSEGYVLTIDTGVPAWVAPGTPGAHATTHKNGGDDEILLNEFGEPTGAVAFDGQQATNLVWHTVADATARGALTAVVGKAVFQTDELAGYICTVAA